MKWMLPFLLLFVCFKSYCQTDTIQLKSAVVTLDKALMEKDSTVLLSLLHPQLTFGHSNGWVETKRDVIKDIISGYLQYEKLETTNISIVTGKDWASVRMNVVAKGVVNEKPFDLQLYVLQVWKRMKNGWQLIARQSAKLK